jgi:hypothetical protein
MAMAAHVVRFNQLIALNIPDLLLTIGNRMHLHDVLKFTTVRWPSRGDVGPMQLGDLRDMLRETAINWVAPANIIIPNAAPADAALANWWQTQGKTMCDRFEEVLKKDQDEYNEELKSGRALKLVDREAIMRRPIYANFMEQVNRQDYPAARAIIDGPTNDARMLSRAMNCFNSSTPVPPASDSVARSFYTLAMEYQSLQEPEIEGEWYAAFGADGVIMMPDLPIKLRSLLQAVEQVAVNFMDGLALVLSTSTVKVSSRELSDPAKVSSQQLEQGLGFMLRIYELIFGAQLGPRSKDIVMKLWSRWTAKDPQFQRVQESYHGAENNAFSFMTTCIMPKFHQWIGIFWKFMKGSNDVAHAVTLAAAFGEASLANDAFYITFAVYVQNMSNQQAAPAGSANSAGSTVTTHTPAAGSNSNGANDGKYMVNGKLQCTWCIDKGAEYPKTNHPVKDCHGLKKEIAKKRNAHDQHGGKGKGKGRGSKRGRGKGNGGKGKHAGKGKWGYEEQHWQHASPPQGYGKGNWEGGFQPRTWSPGTWGPYPGSPGPYLGPPSPGKGKGAPPPPGAWGAWTP